MGIAYVSSERKISAFAAAALLLSSLSLGGCATSTAGSSLMDARAETPAPPKASGYLPVEDLPKHDKPAMTLDERLKLHGLDPVFSAETSEASEVEEPPAREPAPAHKPGRNDPCPCGSGKKYKKCHGR